VRASVLAARLFEDDDFDAKEELLAGFRCDLCGLPLDYGVPPNNDLLPPPDPADEAAYVHKVCAVAAKPSSSGMYGVFNHRPWSGVNNLRDLFDIVINHPSTRADIVFWDGPQDYEDLREPSRWKNLHQAKRALFFVAKHGYARLPGRTDLLQSLGELPAMVTRDSKTLMRHWILELGIILKRLGADSYTLLKPYMDKAR